MAHTSVLVEVVVNGLDLAPGLTVLDGTVGEGGHSAAIAEAVGGKVKIIGFDVDQTALAAAEARLRKTHCDFLFFEENFRNLDRSLAGAGIGSVDRILLDLGVRSAHFETSGRGFSVQRDEPLRMTLGATSIGGFTARDVVNDWDEENLRIIIERYGEERAAAKIARAIVERRTHAPIETSGQLAELVVSVLPRHSRIHPATKTFQAIRIAVNDELRALEEGLRKGRAALVPGGRIAVISFHSLEDRIVKRFFQAAAGEGDSLITKRPLVASAEEQRRNPRARSAKLRILQTLTT
jgi:16S rRNA (cytosine1402-N4)-methyltransferase